MRTLYYKTSPFMEPLIGIIFLLGAILKALDINLFSVQIAAYGVITTKSLLPYVALGTLAVETFLGAALLLRLRFQKLTFLALTLLLLVFTGLIIYGWAFNELEDCGCFGPLEMSPGISITKNILLLILTAIAWHHAHRTSPAEAVPLHRYPYVRLACTCVFVAGLLGYAYVGLQAENLPDSPEQGKYSAFVFDLPEGHFNLGEGEYLVALLSMSCEHCMEVVPELNELFFLPDLPPIVALCLEENEGAMSSFCAQTEPLFPMYSIGNRVRLYFELIGEETLGLSYVRDGHSMYYWDGVIPPYDELQSFLQQVHEPHLAGAPSTGADDGFSMQ